VAAAERSDADAFSNVFSARPVRGRWRHLEHGLVLLVGGAAAWVWFGPLIAVGLVCGLHRLARTVPPAVLVLSAHQVRGARLAPWRVQVKLRRGPEPARTLEVFGDELSGEDWTRLRRWLKSLAR
jgi:hypothetical protein